MATLALTAAFTERFLTLVDRIDFGDCWMWQGFINPSGYGRLSFNGRKWLSHRLVWTLLVGPIPAGMTLDHLCRNKPCVNPDHLEPVTLGDNIRRSYNRAGLQLRLTHCYRGHLLAGANLYPKRLPRRVCVACSFINNSLHRKTA